MTISYKDKMKINTRHFGEIEVDENTIITFGDGIPSFEEVKKYVLLDSGDIESPFKWLQSVDNPSIAFAIADPFLIKKDYEVNINDNDIKILKIESKEDVTIYSIVVVPDDISKISMNLKAPVIINNNKRIGMQVILDTDKYSVRHYILEELRRQEVTSNAGTDKEKGTINSNKR